MPEPPRRVPFSVLDLAPVPSGSTTAQALQNSLDLAQHVERLGFHRYWVAEHHNMPGIASSAPAVLIGHVASVTSRLRVGSGGVMLPNHSPLVVAEQFGMLEAFHPGRIDLGIGRAPGTDQVTAAALRGDPLVAADRFPRELGQLLAYFDTGVEVLSELPVPPITAVPARGNVPEFWLLGSSDYSAQVAAYLGLPFAFAHHFSPENTLPALAAYRGLFQPASSPAFEPASSRTSEPVSGRTSEPASSPASERLSGSRSEPASGTPSESSSVTPPEPSSGHQSRPASDTRSRGTSRLEAPYALVCAAVVCADTDQEAAWHALPGALSFLRLRRGQPGLLPTPEEAAAYPYTDQDRAFIAQRQAHQIIGSPHTVLRGLTDLLDKTRADELMITTIVHSHPARLRSYELIAEHVMPHLGRAVATAR